MGMGLREGHPDARPHEGVLPDRRRDVRRCPGPVFEFGSYQVEGQVDYADLRGLFPARRTSSCDMRPGKGVDRVEDVSRG